MQNLVEIERRERTKAHVFHFLYFFFVRNNAPQINVAGDLVTLLEQDIALRRYL